MAVRFDTSGEKLSRTTNLPSITGFTMMGWFMLSVDRDADTDLMVFGNPASDLYYSIGPNSTGTQLNTYNGNSNVNGTSLTVGTWYHVAMVVSGSGASQFLVYL